MKETTKQNLAILAITILLGGIIFISLNFIQPSLDRHQILKESIAETEEKIKITQEYLAKTQSLIENYNALAPQVENMEVALPDNPQTEQTLAILDKIGQDNNITFTRLNFQEIPTTDETGNITFGILEVRGTAVASYPDLKKFLEEVEKELRLADLKNLEMNPVIGVEEMQATGSKKSTAKKPSEPMFNVQLIYNFYYLP